MREDLPKRKGRGGAIYHRSQTCQRQSLETERGIKIVGVDFLLSFFPPSPPLRWGGEEKDEKKPLLPLFLFSLTTPEIVA
jgi:hypothetical protein